MRAASSPDAASDLGAVVRALEHLPAPAHVVEVDPAGEFPFVAVNAAMEQLMRMPRDRIVGRVLSEFAVTPATREAMDAHRLVARTGAPHSYTLLFDRPSVRHLVRCTLTPLTDVAGRVTHILGVDCEVTADLRSQLEREAEERRIRAQEELESRARADALVADASTRLLSAPAERVGEVVRRALGQFCEQIGADHGALWQADETERRFVRAHTWSDPAIGDRIDRTPAAALADDMPWADEHGETSDEPLFVPDVAALPPEAAAERSMLDSLGVRSLVSVTIVHDDRLLGVVSVVWVRQPASPRTAATFPALRILGNSLLAALDRARAEEALRRRRDAEALVAEVARELLGASAAEIDDAVTRGLERTARFVGAQAASLATIAADGAPSTRSHLWDVDPERVPHWVETRDPETDRWIRERVQGEDLVIARVADDLVGVVPTLRERLVSYGVQAIGYLPLRGSGKLLGWVSLVWFEGVPGPHAAVTLPALRVLGEVYLLALDRARAAESLRKSTRSLEWAQSTAHIGSWSFEPATGEVTWSGELYRILGFEPGSVPATPETFHRIVAPPAGGGVTDAEQLRHIDESYRGTRRAVRPDGEERVVVTDFEAERDADGAVLHILGTVQDVTEAVRAEQAVRDSEARFRALVLESGELIQLVDADGTILYASPAVERDIGWDVTGTRVTDSRLIDVIHPDDRESLLLKFVDALDRPHEPVQVAYRVQDRQGNWRSREAMLTNMLDDPRVNAVVLNARDVTERRELEEQLRESQKMEAIGQLAGGIAHDFNNLLTAISGYTVLLMDDVPDGSPMRTDLEQIQRAADRAAALVEKLLQFSRRQPTHPVLLDVNEVIESLGSLFERVIGEHIELETVLSPDAGLVRADRSHVEQVVINFVVNARDAMPNGGRLTITSTDVVLDNADAERLALRPGRYLRLDVSDTGTGMDETVTARVFEPFFTTKGVGKGTGLGLSTVYGIVTGAGGHVSVASRAGEGATFTVHLPVVRAGEGPPAAPPSPAAQQPLTVAGPRP